MSAKTHEKFVEEVKNVLPNVKIIGTYIKNSIPVECECLIDHYRWFASPANLLRGHGCPVCSGRAVMRGLNDMLTTNPEIKDFLVNIEDGYKYKKSSHKHIFFKCPYCGNIRKLEIKSVITQGFSCPICGDGVSYPNKFARGFLSQFDLDLIKYEYSPSWANGYFYDNYFDYKGNKYILEMDGIFHYKTNTMSGQTKEESQLIDKLKDDMAMENGICVIRIDCRKSDPYFIKENIYNSKLRYIFDLNIVDWKKCNDFGKENLVKKVCDFYQENKLKYTKKEICKMFSIGKDTLRRYLRIGENAGWIINDIDEEILRSFNTDNKSARRVLVRDYSTMELLYDFKSRNLCSKFFTKELGINLDPSKIINLIENNYTLNNKYIFEYYSTSKIKLDKELNWARDMYDEGNQSAASPKRTSKSHLNNLDFFNIRLDEDVKFINCLYIKGGKLIWHLILMV